jgi:hypothetical protein
MVKIIIKLSKRKAVRFARHLKQEHPKYSRSLKLKT